MQRHGAPIEPSPADWSRGPDVFDAGFLNAMYDPSPATVAPLPRDKATAVAAVILVLGVVLLWFVPLGGALLLVTGGVALAVAYEEPLTSFGETTSTQASPPSLEA